MSCSVYVRTCVCCVYPYTRACVCVWTRVWLVGRESTMDCVTHKLPETKIGREGGLTFKSFRS